MAQILDGKKEAEKIKDEIRKKILNLEKKPGLAVILVGENPASKIYVNNKEKDCKEIGFYSEIHRLPEETQASTILSLIDKLNNDEKIHGIIVQLPLPKHLNSIKITNSILPEKDVDGFTFVNMGKLLTGDYSMVACTPKGCLHLIKQTGISIEGKNAVIVGRSNIVGKPMAILLMHSNATVTICHSKTKNLSEITKAADILVAAIGKAKMITKNMVKEGSIVIDVGMNKDENNKLCGDVDFENVKEKVAFITPVPGGVGPMTRAMLMQNTYEAFLNLTK